MRQVRLTEKVGARRKGQIVSYDDASAARLVEAGRAEYVSVESAVFDPAGYTVEEVTEYLATADAAEVHRVLAAERAGKARKSILDA